ncbi:phage baseplate assembly protein V [uncultured Tateyamaria sp.]|uniref:phage baseplate assembly protein V n=1 Tax=uncultured Tateyamaria sp. TaxID=455651 RepID=UPI002605AA6B|nr:phage baseplate assembly protein V [uncultured Tateyamaria sp.]
MSGLPSIIAGLQRQIVELERRQANVMRSGKVVDVDPATQRVKVELGDADNPLVSPWIRWSDTGGAAKTWNPPTVGALMTVMSPMGDLDEKSLAISGGYTDTNPAPSADGDATVFTLGGLTITLKGASAVVVLGGVTVELTGSGITVTGGDITHDGKDVGATHTHGGISKGPDDTKVPN